MRKLPFLILPFVALSLTPTARADNCSDLTNPIYASGVNPAFLVALSKQLANANMTLIFTGSSDCGGLSSILPVDAGGVALGGSAGYFDSTGGQKVCTLPLTGIPADLGIIGLTPASCAAKLDITIPSSVQEFEGPAVPYLFVTPTGVGAPPAISAEQAYFVFGYGVGGGIAPWDLEDRLNFIFASNQATLDVTSGAIGVLPASMIGAAEPGATMVSALTSSSIPSAAIGMMGSDIYDANRTNVDGLAFRGYGQDFAWTPDVDGGFEKRNVREGRYVLFASMHFVILTTADGQAVTAGGQTMLDILDGKSGLPIDLDAMATAAHLVPDCAMKVQRTQDGFDPVTHYGLAPSARTQSCDCYFDSIMATTSCMTCPGGFCPGDLVCRRNFCEAF